MADYKFIFKLTPNDRDVIINPEVLLNGYPDVEYPVPFVQTNQLGYVIDPETFKFVDPSLIPYMEGPYPARLEIEYSTYLPLLEFYAENNKKLFNGFDLRFEYNFSAPRGERPEWFQSIDKTYDYCDISLFVTTAATDFDNIWRIDSKTFKINFRFKLYWGDGKSHSNEIDWNHIIPSLNVYPFQLRMTIAVNPDVINSMDGCFKMPLPDINNEPDMLNPNEPSFEQVMADIQPYLSHKYNTPLTYGDRIINYLISTASEDSPYKFLSYNRSRISFIKEYIRAFINNEQVDFTKSLLQNPHVLTYPYYISQNSYSMSLYEDTDRQQTYTYSYIEEHVDDIGIVTYTVQENTEVTQPFYRTWLYLPDSRDMFVRDLLTFKVEATFSHPTTFLSVNAMGNYTLQQKPYPGDRVGYIKMKYMDDYPLEIWSPYVQVIYGKSKKDEANVKVNKNLYTEYLGFIINSSFHANEPKKYETYRYAKLYKKNILSAAFIDPSTGNEEIVNENNIDHYINLATNDKDFYNKYVNVIDIYDVSIANYFNNYPDCDVYSDYDLKVFEDRWNICKSVSTSTNLQTIYCLQTPKEQEEIFEYGLWNDSSHMFLNTDLSVGLSKYDVSFYGKYTAVYANYKIRNKDYYQIIKETQESNFSSNVIMVKFDCSTDEYPADFSRDYDISEYEFKNIINTHNYNTSVIIDSGSYNQSGTHYMYGAGRDHNQTVKPNIVGTVTKRYEIEDDTISNYRIVSTDDGNTTQYKFCVNNLLYDGSTLQIINGIKQKVDVQVPRFGVYGIYYGLFAYNFDVYDYETVKIPYIELSDYEDSNENEDVIIHSITDIIDINKYIIDLSSGLRITGELIDKPAIINIGAEESAQTQYVTYGARAPKKKSVNNILGAEPSSDNVVPIGPVDHYQLKITNIPPSLNYALFVNGGKITIGNQPLAEYETFNDIRPCIFAIHLNNNYTVSQPYILDTEVIKKFYTGEIEQYINTQGEISYREKTEDTIYKSHLLITNGENEKHFNTFDNIGHDIDTNLDSFMILRTNPKLTGNIKLVVDTDYNIYLDTFKVSPKLANQRYRKQGVPADGNYPYDVKRIFATLPNTELFKVPENSLKAHKVYNDFNDQYETMYEYGAETNIDNLYNENMKILAPLHIGKDIPDFFTIFRYDETINNGTFNDSNYKNIDKFIELLENAETVMTYDLREYTSIGQYLNNYKNMLTNYGQCYLQFIEEDNYRQSAMYRQGTNIWKGVSINRGILTNQSETTYFAEKILNSSLENKQETFNNFIMQGFERNNLLYPNILNIEFMFNDNSQEEYSMHRYFGLYLTENDFIKYGYIIPGQTSTTLKKYDINGNPYVGDVNIYHDIFNNDYRSRLFYAVTNDFADRVKSEIDIDNFLSNNVKNKPEKNMINMKSDQLIFADTDKTFITLHLSEPLAYGEHIKIIAMNKPLPVQVYNDLNNFEVDDKVENTVLPYEHIVFEIIASNNDVLRKTSKFISPVETINECRYSENTKFYRISFYSQDISYSEISATISEQIERIAACIKKFNSFIKVGSYNHNSISIISEHTEMYLQHIAAHDFDDFKYDYFNVQNNNFNPDNAKFATTNKDYTDSIDFIPHKQIINVDQYIQEDDIENDWIKGRSAYVKPNSSWISYVETEDPRNIKYENISYFNAFEKFEMHALSNQSDYFDGYYAAFSNYGFESIGWRYNTIVKFIETSKLKNTYTLYDNKVYEFIKEVKYPIIMTDDNMYETICIFNIDNGYLRNNIIDPDIYEEYTSKQQFIFKTAEFQVISSPYDVNYSMVMSIGDALLKNNQVQLYKPKYANIAIMGISNIKDIDTIVDSVREIHNESKLTVYCKVNERIPVDESDYRIQHGVMYELYNGQIEAGTYLINSVSKFIIVPTENESEFKIYFENINSDTGDKEVISQIINILQTKSDCEIKIVDKQVYQDYNYTTNIPQIQIKNLFRDINDIEHSELLYPITPSVNCNWKSNGQYFDFNNVLDVSNISQDYEFVGNFVENTYTPALYNTNQYITNKIDSIAFIDNEPKTFRDIILYNKIQHPIKHFLIDNVNIDTAMAYYNSNIQSLEFIFSGVKFEIKLNSKLVNTYIHLDAYDNYEVFVVNDYNISKRNEMFISQVERFILLINHNFYIDYAHEAVNNIKTINDDVLKAWQEYSVTGAPYAMNLNCTDRETDNISGFTYRRSLHESLLSAIDPHNLWNSFFIQFNIPKVINDYDVNDAQFIQTSFKSIYEYGNYLTMNAETDDEYQIGYMRWSSIDNITHFIAAVLTNNMDPYPLYKIDTLDSLHGLKSLEHMFKVYTYYILPQIVTKIPVLYTEAFPYVLTKADGDYNTLAKKLLKHINTKIAKLSKNYTNFSQYIDMEMHQEHINDQTGVYGAPTPRPPHIDPSEHYADFNFKDRFGLNTEFNIMTMKHISDEDINITPNQNLFITYQDQNDYIINKLSSILGTPVFMLLADEFRSNTYKNYYIPKPYLKKLQEYIEVLLVKETNYEKLKRYIKSVNDNMDIYIITKDSGVRYIKNTEYYNPLIFKLSIPNMIKYNQGWFTPNTINMVEFSVDDKLTDILHIDLLQANTNVTNIHSIQNYTGNKVYDDNKLYTLEKNYFIIPEKSILETTWDVMHYRKYNDEENYIFQPGHETGIDDKSFFGSRCMVMYHEYVLLDQWEFDTANDILSYQITDSTFNTDSTNKYNTEITINVTAAIFNHFINNKAFAENWNLFDNTQYTGMKNYIKNTLSSYYNMNSNIEVIVYGKDIAPHEPINILTKKPVDISGYTVIEGIDVSEPDLKEDFYTITIKVPYVEGKNIYPNIKIYKK